MMVRSAWLGAAGAFLLAASPVVAQSVGDGIAAWRSGEEERAVVIWTPLAENGDADAQFNLGQAYRLGRGVEADRNRARTLFEQAARQGNQQARTNLGLMLYGEGKRAEGLRWLTQAAEEGDSRALLVVGTALFNGDAIERDMVTGYALVSRAAAQGLRPAQNTLEEMDDVLPIAQRREGVQLAQDLARGERRLSALIDAPVRVAQADPRPQQPAARPAPKPEPAARPAPAPKPTPAKPTAPAASNAAINGWTVQLGAFSRDGAAQALFGRLSGASVFAGKRPAYQEVGAVTRLRVGPFANKAAAQAACDAMASRGQPCFVVAP